MSGVRRLPVFALFAAILLPAAPDTQPLSTLRITVTLVQVDVVVTDSRGRHVTSLRPEDFEILQDGDLQKITHFSYTPEAGNQAPAPSSAPITPGQVKRTVALVVDDLALSFESLVRVRASLRKYVEQQMQPGDLVALVRTGGGVAVLEQFTTDKRVLMEGIDLLKWRFSGRMGLLPINPVENGAGELRDKSSDEPEILDYGYPRSAVGALETIEQVVRGMKAMPGRKSVVFFSDALRMASDVSSAIDHLTDLSNRSAVSLYTIDPRGLRTRSNGADHAGIQGPASGSILGDIAAYQQEDDFRSQEGLSYLARRTGGLFFANNNDIPGCIKQATDDQLGYYLLGYSPREGTFEKNAGKAKFHKVTVRVRRPGLHVRWKTGFTGVPDGAPGAETVPAPQTREQQLLNALSSPFTATGLKVRLTSMYANTPKVGPKIQSMLHFSAKDLSFSRELDGLWHASVDIVTSAYRGGKPSVEQRQRVEDIRLPDELYRRALKEGFLFLMDHPTKLPGTFLMRAVVRDMTSQRIGSASQSVEVPDTRKGQLALSGITLRLEPPSGQAVSAEKDGKVEAWTEGGPAVRRYRPGQSMIYAFTVINPKLKRSTRKPDVVSQVRVFRNGKLLYTGAPIPLPEVGKQDAGRFIGAGMINLGRGLTAGEYLIQVVVTDKLASKKKSQASQWIDFEVTPSPAS